MDHWLICFPAQMSADERERVLREAGTGAPGGVTPLGAEIAVEVDATPAVARALRRRKEVTGVFPSSELSPY